MKRGASTLSTQQWLSVKWHELRETVSEVAPFAKKNTAYFNHLNGTLPPSFTQDARSFAHVLGF
jgi:hypothetical protein